MKRKKHQKNMLLKDFLMEIRKTPNRFFSIVLIILMGSAFLSGIRSAEPDMRLTADAYFDEADLADIRIQGTLGLTEEDLRAVQEVEGVSAAEGLNSVDFLTGDQEAQRTIRLYGDLGEKNRFTVEDGRMPEKTGECALDAEAAAEFGYKIGDVITVLPDEDGELSDQLHTDQFEVVGLVTSPYFLSHDRGTSTVGDGSLDAYAVTVPESFSQETFSAIDVWVDGAAEKTVYTEAYENCVDTVKERIEEELSDARCSARYEEITDDARQDILDAKNELNEEKNSVYDELDDAEEQLNEMTAKTDAGETSLLEYEKELKTAQQKLEEAKRELAEKSASAEEGKKQIAAGRQQVESGLAAYRAGAETAETKKSELDSGYAAYNEGSADLQQKKNAAAEAAVAAAKEKAATELHSAIEAQIAGDEQVLAGIRAALEGKEELIALKAAADAVKEDPAAYESAMAVYNAAYDAAYTAAYDAAVSSAYDVAWPETSAKAEEAAVAEVNAAFASAEQELLETKEMLDAGMAEWEKGYATLQETKQQLDDAAAQLAGKEQELAAAEAALAEGEQALLDSQAQIAEGQQKISEEKTQIETARIQIQDGWNALAENRRTAEEEFADAEKQIQDAEEEITEISYPKWYVSDRSVFGGYTEYGDNALRIKAIGLVFPVLFFLVAALISLTAMTRMVEEQRIQIGTLKALGYGKGQIAFKYIAYALLAALGGSVPGVLIGEKIFPWIIVDAYKLNYPNLPAPHLPYHFSFGFLAVAASILCMVLAALVSSLRELLAVAAELMRPVPPKSGKRILLERIGILWKRLSFSQKSTLRNLFRYKKRFLMTVLGIGGCMALMVVGYGLKDSIGAIADIQYGELQTYSAIVSMQDTASAGQKEEVYSSLRDNTAVKAYLPVSMQSMEAVSDEKNLAVNLVVPSDPAEVSEFYHFRDRVTKNTYALGDEGAILSEKTADLLQVEPGDKLIVQDESYVQYEIPVAAICENYFEHYVYLTPALYQEVFEASPTENAVVFQIKDQRAEEAEEVGTALMQKAAVANVTYVEQISSSVKGVLDMLNSIVAVLIVSAGLLAFVVLYNLNTINMNERRRELATLKVLGFYDPELAVYLYRENILLTLFGIVLGIFLGKLLHRFIITTVEVDSVMFGRVVMPESYIYGVLWTMLFAVIVNFIMYFQLKKIDMVESLKSVE